MLFVNLRTGGRRWGGGGEGCTKNHARQISNNTIRYLIISTLFTAGTIVAHSANANILPAGFKNF